MDPAFRRRLTYRGAQLGLFLAFCLIEWWWLRWLWDSFYLALMLAFVLARYGVEFGRGWLGLPDPTIRSEWRWPVPGCPQSDRVELHEEPGPRRRAGAWMVCGGMVGLGASALAGWLRPDDFLGVLGAGVSIWILLLGMIYSVQDLSTPLLTADAEGMRSLRKRVSWSSVGLCQIRSELNLRGAAVLVYPILHGREGAPPIASFRGEFSRARPDDCDRLLALLRERFRADERA